MARSESLPRKFTTAERRAYDWLWDCGFTAWVVDLLTKEVHAGNRDYINLVAYAKHCGIKEPSDG